MIEAAMMRFRISTVALSALALATVALAAGAAPATAQAIGDLNAYEFPSNAAKPKAGDALSDLPAPSQLVAPKAEPHRSRPPTVTFAWGSTVRPFRKPATPAGIKSLKYK